MRRKFRLIYGTMLAILFIYFLISLIAGGRAGSLSFSHIVQVSIIQGIIAIVLFFVEKNVVEEYLIRIESDCFYYFSHIGFVC